MVPLLCVLIISLMLLLLLETSGRVPVHFLFFTFSDSNFYFSLSFPWSLQFNLQGVYTFPNQQRRTAIVQKHGEKLVIRNLQVLKLCPTFGGGHDIYISSDANSNTNSYTDFGQSNYYAVPSVVKDLYTILAGTRSFSPDEVEVYYLDWVTFDALVT